MTVSTGKGKGKLASSFDVNIITLYYITVYIYIHYITVV